MLETRFVQLVPVAQWIARWTSNPKVAGSNPAGDNHNIFFRFRIFILMLKIMFKVKYEEQFLKIMFSICYFFLT